MEKGHVVIALNTSWNLVNFRGGLIRRLVAEGYRVTGMAPPDEYSERLAELGCHYEPMPMDNKGTSILRDLALLLRFYRALRQLRPDVVLCYTVKPNVYGSLAAHILGIPVVYNVAGLGTVFINPGVVTRVVRLLYRAAFSRARHVFFQNDDDRDYFVSTNLVDAGRTGRLPGSGINLETFGQLPLPGGKPFRFLLVARLLYDKGIGEYVAAARRLKVSHPDVECCLVGFLDVENVTAVSRADVEAWEEEGVIRYLGASDNIREQIADCHCIVLPSYREGLSRTLLEGAASGRPLIATNVTGCRELVRSGVNGFLVRPRDEADLYEQMKGLVDLGPDTWQAFGEASRHEIAPAYDEKIVIDRYLDIIHRETRTDQ